MRKAITILFRRFLPVGLALSYCLPVLAGNLAVTIHVKDGSNNAVVGAAIYAIANGSKGPDGQASQVGTTDGSGDLILTLDDTKRYEVIADKHLLCPTARTQYFGPNHLHLENFNAGPYSITLNQPVSGRGQIVIQVNNATGLRFISGGLRKKSTGSDVAFGGCVTNSTGACNITFSNVSPAGANTYDFGVNDPSALNGQGIGFGGTVTNQLTDTVPLTYPLDISQGIPPDLSAGTGDSGGSNTTIPGAIVRGIVEEVDVASNTVPWGGINLKIKDGNGQVVDVRGSGINEQGRFEFVGMSSGTYFVQTSPSCNQSTGFCYEGAKSTSAFEGTPSDNDIVITNSNFINNEVVFKHIKLPKVAPGAGQLLVKVRVKNSIVLIPNSSVNLNSDWSRWWSTAGSSRTCADPNDPLGQNNPGLTSKNSYAASGKVTFSSITAGNYMVSAWTPFNNSNNNQGSMFNAGDDQTFAWGGGSIRGCDGDDDTDDDDLRLTVSTDGQVFVYDVYGATQPALVDKSGAIPTITIYVTTPTLTYVNTLHGTLKFPETADLREDPITISLNESDCGNDGCQGNFTTIGGEDSVPATSYDYSLQVPAGKYWIDVQSGYWGRTDNNGGGQASFSDTVTDIRKDFNFARAGRVTGTLSKPDGSVFKTGNIGNSWVSAGINPRCGNHGGSNAQVNEDGTFSIGGVLPGDCALIPQIWGNSATMNFAPKDPSDPSVIVTVKANQTVEKNIAFVNGVVVSATVDRNTLPPVQEFYDNGWNKGEGYEIHMIPSGKPLDPTFITTILTNDDEANGFFYAPAGNSTPCGGGWPGGYCPQRIPTGTARDFLLLRRGGIDGGFHQYITVLDRIDNKAIDEASVQSPDVLIQGSSVPAVHVTFTETGLTDGCRISGTVIATNIIRKTDFDSFGGSFDNFIKFIPLMTAKDANGKLLGAGLVTPPPELIADAGDGDAIDEAIAAGNWEAFKTALGGLGGWGYEFRAMPTDADITLVGTTPNYPPVFKKVHTAALGSTTTWNIDWDDLVGSGGTISGTVTGTAVIENAAVTIKAPGFKEKTANTDASGLYKFEGLPKGPFKVTVTAAGYAPQAKKTVISGEETDVVSFTLDLGPGSISGKVEEIASGDSGAVRRPVEGATVLAYDDTFNAAHPGVPLALIKTQTDSSGDYSLTGMISAHDYVITVRADGRYPKRETVTATGVDVSGTDFLLEQKPLQVDVVIEHDDANNKFLFKILNPQNFDDGSVFYYNAANTFNSGTDPELTNDIHLPDGSLVFELADSTLTAGITYNLHIIATPADGSPDVTVEVPFGLSLRNNAIRNIDEALLGDPTEGDDGVPENRVVGGDGVTSIDIDPGTLLPSSDTSLPTTQITEEDPVDDGVTDIVGEAVTITFNNVQFTDNPLPFSMPFDAANIDDISSLGLFQFDEATGEWKLITNEISVDPVQGTVTGFISADGTIVPEANLPSPAFNIRMKSKKGTTMAALKTKKGYQRNPRAAASGAAMFAVGVAVSTGSPTTDGNYRAFNYPNPFNLKMKTTTVSHDDGSSVPRDIMGTHIVVAPVGSGACTIKIRIYNVAGDMVREIVDSTAIAGNYNYIDWDGRNTAGDEVASGVYFAKVDAPGAPKRDPVKMVVVK